MFIQRAPCPDVAPSEIAIDHDHILCPFHDGIVDGDALASLISGIDASLFLLRDYVVADTKDVLLVCPKRDEAELKQLIETVLKKRSDIQ